MRTTLGWRWCSAPWMSLKSRSVRVRSPSRRASSHRSRRRVLPLFVASKALGSNGSFRTIVCRTLSSCLCLRRLRRDDEPAPSAAAHLTALAAGVSGLVGGPFVSRPFLVRRAAALAGDFALLLGRHRCKSPPFLAFTCSHRLSSVFPSKMTLHELFRPDYA